MRTPLHHGYMATLLAEKHGTGALRAYHSMLRVITKASWSTTPATCRQPMQVRHYLVSYAKTAELAAGLTHLWCRCP